MNFKISLLISGALATYMSPQIDPDTISLLDSESHPIVQSYQDGCSPIGSYKDKAFDRAMSIRVLVDESYGLTVDQCEAACSDYKYFAIQNGYYACWCDNDIQEITKHGEGSCGPGGAASCNYVYECSSLQDGEKIIYVDEHTAFTRGLEGRAKGSCISFKPELQRNLGRYAGSRSEPWVTVTSDPTQCALVEFEKSDNPDEYYIYMKGRVDGVQITPGYLGTRGEDIDERDDKSYYMSATLEKVSTFMLEEINDGYAFYQGSNSNGVAEYYYIHAITSAGDPIHDDGYTSDLILRHYEFSQATIFEIDSLFEEKDQATKVMAAMMTLIALISYV